MIVLVGGGASGKDFLRKQLVSIGFSSIVSTTTRPKRQGEIDGEHYFFITHEEFEELIKKDSFIEYDKFDGNFYGINKAHMKTEFYSVCILTPRGLKKILTDDMIIIYLKISDHIRRERMIKERNYTYEQVDKRIQSDNNLLIDLPSNIDCTITHPFFTLNDIAQFTSRTSQNLDANNNNIFKWFGLKQEAINEINESRNIYPVGKSNRFLLADFLVVKCDRNKLIPSLGKVIKDLVVMGFHHNYAVEYVTSYPFIDNKRMTTYEFIMKVFDARTSNDDKVDSSNCFCCFTKHTPKSYSYLK